MGSREPSEKGDSDSDNPFKDELDALEGEDSEVSEEEEGEEEEKHGLPEGFTSPDNREPHGVFSIIWNHPTREQYKGARPPVRCKQMACQPTPNTIFIFGGWSGPRGMTPSASSGVYTNESFLVEVPSDININSHDFGWKSFGNTVTPYEGSPPAERYMGAMCPIDQNSVFLFGGSGPMLRNDAFQYDIRDHFWFEMTLDGTAPEPRYGHTMVKIPDRKAQFLIFGGFGNSNSRLNDVCIADLSQMQWVWPKVKGAPPDPRSEHAACVVGNKMYIMGGYRDRIPCLMKDVHVLDLETMEWEQVYPLGNQPRGRFGHSMISVGRDIVIFGGYAEREYKKNGHMGQYLNDLWVYDTFDNIWYKPATRGMQPSARYFSSIFHIPPPENLKKKSNGKLYIFGGAREFYEDWTYFNDLVVGNLEWLPGSVEEPDIVSGTK